MDTEVIVVGAGPVGLTLAIDMAKRGVKCMLVEKKAEPEFLPKMERCNARTMEIYRRLGISDQIRAAGLNNDVPMDVFVVTAMNEPPLLHLPYPSVSDAQAEIAKTQDSSQPAEAYQLISQYTLEPLLKSIADKLPNISVRYGHEFVSLAQDANGVTAKLRDDNGNVTEVRAAYLVGCDGGASPVRKQLGISLRGDGNLLKLRQALYRCDDLYDRIPLGNGPGHGRHYHVADNQATFLIMQDSTKHWTLHSIVESDEDMVSQFAKTVGEKIDFEMLYVGEWKQNLLLADRYQDGRVFLAGDAVHLVIPTGGLGMNTGAGDAIDLSWKLAATLQGWGGPALLNSYEIERRQIGDRNIGASRYASSGRRKWRGSWRPEMNDATPAGEAARNHLAEVADIEQRKTNEMIGAELGYRYVGSPIIWEEPGGPEMLFRTYQPTTWPGARLPNMWLAPGVATQDKLGAGYSILRLGSAKPDVSNMVQAIKATGAPVGVVDIDEDRVRDVYGHDLILVRPDLHIVWRGNAQPDDVSSLAAIATGQPMEGMLRVHASA